MPNVLFLVLLLACPLMMIFMMRGMHGGGDRTGSGTDSAGPEHRSPATDATITDARIEQLERELAALRSAHGDGPASEPGRRP